jgi:phage tail-like protein
MPAGATEGDAITVSRFSLTVDGVEIGQFSELGGITSVAEPLDLVGRVMQKLPGRRKPPTVTLKRGLSKDTEIFAWHQSVVEGESATARKSATLTMYNTAGEPVAKYYLESAWPSEISISGLKAGSSEVLYETVTLMCEDLQRVAV